MEQTILIAVGSVVALIVAALLLVRLGGPRALLRRGIARWRREQATGQARERMLVRLKLVDKSCGSCTHFDRRAFQEFIAKDPTWSRLSSIMSPDQMGSASHGDKDAYGMIAEDKSPERQARSLVPKGRKASWADYGLCTIKGEANYERYSCEQWD